MTTTTTPDPSAVEAQARAALEALLAQAADDDDMAGALQDVLEDMALEVESPERAEAIRKAAEAQAAGVLTEAEREARKQDNADRYALRRERATRAAKATVRKEQAQELHKHRDPLSILTGAALRDLDEPEPPAVVEKYLAMNSSVLLFSPPKTGKTVHVHDLCASLTTGAALFGKLEVAPIPEGAQVVLIDTELPRANARRRMGEAKPDWDHLTLVSAENNLDELDATQPEVYARWVETLRSLKAWVVIIDTLGPVVSDAGLDANTEGHKLILAWKQLVNEAGGVGTVFIDHSNPNHTEVSGPRGDSQKANYAGGYLYLRPAGDFGMDDELPTEYIISGHTRAGNLYLDLTREGAHFRVEHGGVPQAKVDPVEQDAYDYGGRVQELVEDMHRELVAQYADDHPDKERAADHPQNYPSLNQLRTRATAQLSQFTRDAKGQAYGRPRWGKILDELLRQGVLEDVNHGAQIRFRANLSRRPVNPRKTTVVGVHGQQGTPLDLDAVPPRERVFGPQAEVETAPDDTPEDVVEPAPEDAVADTPQG